MRSLITDLRKDCLNPRLSDEAADELERLRNALANIISHQKIISGDLAELSTTSRIAVDALDYLPPSKKQETQ